ncbi:MAG TPA: alpha/beta fold hydrolase, partial [Kofleriaceae bacterium]|nr:alpha/beta fold hydrolase [Kofleriaceae bacterium]
GSPGAASPPASPGAAAAPGRPHDRLTPCTVEGVAEKLLCGTYAVWENRTTRQGRKIDLHIVVVPGTGKDLAPDPLFGFAGGPGDSASGAARGWVQERALRAHRDIVLVDQRGSGASHRLDCKVPRDRGDVQAYFEPTLPPAEVHRCRAELEQIADLAQYTTSIAADDLDEVRAWLGYDRINLTGGSYGTRAAQVYLRRHGDHVRSAILIGVVAMDQLLPLYHARDGKASLDRLFETCASTPACAAAFPDLPAEHQRVLAGLDRERGRATVQSPVDHRPTAVTIPRDVFAEQIRFTLYNARTAAVTPYVIHRAAQGDFDPFARLAMLWEPGFRDILAFGMHLSVTCAEDVPFIAPDAVEPAIAGTYLQGYRVRQQIAACKDWPRGEVPADYHQPVRSDVAVLLISGPYDPVTPPRFAEQVVKQLSHGRHVIVPDGHHGSGGLSREDCITGLTTAFIERGTADGLDTACVADMKRPPFITDDAGFAALLQQAGG